MTEAYVKVASLRPDTAGHNLRVKVVESTSGQNQTGRSGSSRIAESIVGDESGVISLTARNEQVELLEVGKSIEINNGKIEMFKGSMRLAVPASGTLQELSQPLSFTPNAQNNLSLIEFELVPLPQSISSETATSLPANHVAES